jgi:hypothetical protein
MFVGRAAELAQLETMLRRAVAGGSAAVVVSGDAGVGKTRLVSELINRAGAQGVVSRLPDPRPSQSGEVRRLRAPPPGRGPRLRRATGQQLPTAKRRAVRQLRPHGAL